ncbi:hypothetical protein Tco_1578353 [Tanacetum coccineum]
MRILEAGNGSSPSAYPFPIIQCTSELTNHLLDKQTELPKVRNCSYKAFVVKVLSFVDNSSSKREIIDKVPATGATLVSNRFEIPLGRLVEYPASPWEKLQEILELLVCLQVASPSTFGMISIKELNAVDMKLLSAPALLQQQISFPTRCYPDSRSFNFGQSTPDNDPKLHNSKASENSFSALGSTQTIMVIVAFGAQRGVLKLPLILGLTFSNSEDLFIHSVQWQTQLPPETIHHKQYQLLDSIGSKLITSFLLPLGQHFSFQLFDLTPWAVFIGHHLLQGFPWHCICNIMSDSPNVGVPPCQGISLKSTSCKFDLTCDSAVADVENRFHLF